MKAGSQIVHEAVQEFLMLRLAEAGQVGVEGGDNRTFVSQVNLDLAEVLALFQEMGCVGMA